MMIKKLWLPRKEQERTIAGATPLPNVGGSRLMQTSKNPSFQDWSMISRRLPMNWFRCIHIWINRDPPVYLWRLLRNTLVLLQGSGLKNIFEFWILWLDSSTPHGSQISAIQNLAELKQNQLQTRFASESRSAMLKSAWVRDSQKLHNWMESSGTTLELSRDVCEHRCQRPERPRPAADMFNIHCYNCVSHFAFCFDVKVSDSKIAQHDASYVPRFCSLS